MNRRMPCHDDASIKDVFMDYLIFLPLDKRERAVDFLNRTDTNGAWKWREYLSPIEFACNMNDALARQSSPEAESLRHVLNEFRPQRLDFEIEVDEIGAEEGKVPEVSGWTILRDASGLPYAEFPFSVKPDLRGEAVVQCDWTRRMFVTPDAAERPLTVKGCLEAVDEFLKVRQPQIEAGIVKETKQLLERDPFLKRLWKDPVPYRPLRQFLAKAVEKYAQKRPPNTRLFFKTSMENYLNDRLRLGHEAQVVLEGLKAQVNNKGKNPDFLDR